MNKKEYPFTKKQERAINKIVALRMQGNQQEADRVLRMLLNDHYAEARDAQATRDKGEQQRIYQEALRKAIEKGTLAL